VTVMNLVSSVLNKLLVAGVTDEGLFYMEFFHITRLLQYTLNTVVISIYLFTYFLSHCFTYCYSANRI